MALAAVLYTVRVSWFVDTHWIWHAHTNTQTHSANISEQLNTK